MTKLCFERPGPNNYASACQALLIKQCNRSDKQGDSFDYRATYCEITCRSSGPISIEHCGEHDVHARHPAYQAFGLESYIGIPIHVDNEIYGTLNFSSPTPYYRKFKEIDIDVMKLMASWIEVELVRRAQEQRLQQLNEKLEYQALYDPLTGLPNRRCLFKKLNAEVAKLREGEGIGSLAVIDIDHFKKVNDKYGHQIGDDVLKKIAKVLKENTHEHGIAARFGGEEFIVVLSDIQKEQVEKHCDALLNKWTEAAVEHAQDAKHPLMSCSIGVVFAKSAENMSIDCLIDEADKALYEAKEKGKAQFVLNQAQCLE